MLPLLDASLVPAYTAALAFGYLCGSIPFGLILTRLADAADIRAIASGNIGWTNLLRIDRKGLAAATLVGNALKGALPVLLVYYYSGAEYRHFAHELALPAAAGAFLGHLFPFWLGFKGGKGVATYIGLLLALAWPIAIAFCLIWLAVAALTRNSSLAALVASAAMPLALWLLAQRPEAGLFALLMMLLWIMHRANIARLVNGTERKIVQRKTLVERSLLRAEKTYDPDHPDHHISLVRNAPGYFMNADLHCDNPLFCEIKHLAFLNKVPNFAWRRVLKRAMAEAATVPGFSHVMDGRAYIERYAENIARTHQAYYSPGWVNVIDAQFLYWAVRKLKPKVVVQTGLSNGLSCAFMMLALAKNGPEGRFYGIDLPHIFDPRDPAWTQKGERYGVMIPEGKTSGWLMPDIYSDRFDVEIGDAKVLLPKLVDRLDTIDLFFHDSDHTYNHMMFEFEQVARKLASGGVVLADDIAWNASLWDFADARGIPGYNYRGTIGLAFCSK